MARIKRLIISISGSTGVGKTTAAQFLAKAIGAKTASFGEYIRHLALRHDAPIERTVLQQIGEAQVRKNPVEFATNFLDWVQPDPERTLILDGVRHQAVDEELRRWAALNNWGYMRVHITASEHTRARRRTSGSAETLRALDQHPVEYDSQNSLIASADIAIDGECEMDKIISEVLTKIPNNYLM